MKGRPKAIRPPFSCDTESALSLVCSPHEIKGIGAHIFLKKSFDSFDESDPSPTPNVGFSGLGGVSERGSRTCRYARSGCDVANSETKWVNWGMGSSIIMPGITVRQVSQVGSPDEGSRIVNDD
jgi:hypothetical protein